MNSELITVGTELLLGDIVNTNTVFLSKKLAELGINVYFQTAVGDNKERLKEVVSLGIKRSDLIILTGGLGPTEDDITKEAVSEVLNRKLILDNQVLEKIELFFKKCCTSMTHNNVKQALVPEDSKIIKNEIGTAPGIMVEDNGRIIIMLPGPPKELELMFNKYVYPLLRKKSKYIIKSKVIKTIGAGESFIETEIKDIIHEYENPTVATYAKSGQVEIRITAKAFNEYEADQLIKNVVNEVECRIGEYIYGYNDTSIEEVVFKLLKSNNLTIGFCESCTGGLITSRFTQVPGVSQVLDRGIVTYSNKSKIQELGVKEETLFSHGAVSSQTALEMAKGLKEKTGVNIALSVTGIAGPTGGTAEKPVGLVYIALATDTGVYSKKFNLTGSRNQIQWRTTNHAFNEIRKYLISLK